MANEQNLKPLNTLTKKAQREIQVKGAIASNKKQAERRSFKEILSVLLQEKSVDNPNLTNDQMMNIRLIAEAINGNVKAFEIVRDTIGEKPTDKLEANLNVNEIKVVIED
jgi:hypothetical protein